MLLDIHYVALVLSSFNVVTAYSRKILQKEEIKLLHKHGSLPSYHTNMCEKTAVSPNASNQGQKGNKGNNSV